MSTSGCQHVQLEPYKVNVVMEGGAVGRMEGEQVKDIPGRGYAGGGGGGGGGEEGGGGGA